MRNVKWGIFLVASLLMGPSVAQACIVDGTVVCEGTGAPVAFVTLSFDDGFGGVRTAETDSNGAFSGLGLWGGTWDISLDSILIRSDTIDGNLATVTLAPIVVSADVVPECQPPTICDTTGVSEAPFSLDRPLGNPSSECAYFGNFVPVGGGFDIVDGVLVATTDAAFAIVKSGRAFYGVTVGVADGDALNLPDTKNAVSHVTYCGCPTTEDASSSAALSASTENTAGGCSSGSAGALALLGLAAVLPRLRRRRA